MPSSTSAHGSRRETGPGLRGPGVRTFCALIVAPLLALADQSVAFALVGWACAHGSAALLHATHAVFLVLTLVLAAGARQVAAHAVPGRRGAGLQLRFLGGVAAAVALLSAVAIAVLWIPTWMIPACVG